jgi:hypothetical protein
MSKGFLLALFLLCTTYYLYAQPLDSIHGVLTDFAHTPLAGGIVSLIEPDSTTILAYTFTDEQGRWALKKYPKRTGYLLKSSYWGTTDLYRFITDTTQSPIYLNMPNSTLALDTLQITDTRLSIVVKGDTLTYYAKSFVNGTEDNLGDLLQKLPGINIQNDQIYFKCLGTII